MSINAGSDDIVHDFGNASREDDRYKFPPPPTYNVYPPPMPDRSARFPGNSLLGDSMSDSAAFASGKISSVRRTFCLFVTFDLGLTFILWVIYTQLMGGIGWDKFATQVENYDFKHSLFDTVMLATVRFVFLLLAYALFRIRHWWTVALTTLLSSAYLMAKVFLYDFASNSKNPLSYCLLIVAFVLAWVETWFLDFKVLPWEKKEIERMAVFPQSSYGGVSDTRRLLQPEDTMSTATFDRFYSPTGSPAGSDIEEEEEPEGAAASQVVSPSQASLNGSASTPLHVLQEYHQVAEKCWEWLWTYVNQPDEAWKHESGKTVQEGIIHSQQTKDHGKIFKLQGEVNIAPKTLWHEMVFNITTAHTWNPTLIECRTVMSIDSNTDIGLNIANGIGGIVSSRDFVDLRRWGSREGIYMSAGQGCTHPDVPPTKKHTRGINGPGGWVFRPVPGEPNKCIFVWIMNTDIKGWIPQRLMDQAASSVLTDYLKYLRQHALSL